MYSYDEKSDQANKPVIIQDIVVVAPKRPKDKIPPTGVFDENLDLAYLMSKENHQELALLKLNQENNVYSTIESLVQQVSTLHREQNFDNANQILPDKENTVTRLVTNEFMFYTAIPFSAQEFARLQERIFSLAKKSPENLHLVLSSFAVLTPDNKVMDVAVHVQCGENPKFNFIVKSNSADSDPKYTDYSADASQKSKRKKLLSNVDIEDKEIKLDSFEMTIDDKQYRFSFNNVIECVTAGDVPFFTAVDICLDHEFEVAKKNADKLIDEIHERYLRGDHERLISLLVSYVVTSNYIDVKNKRGLGVITQADPIRSLRECKEQTEQSPQKGIIPSFGPPLVSIETSPLQCGEWPEQQRARVVAHNNNVLGIESPAIEEIKIKKPAKPIDYDMMADLDSEESDNEVEKESAKTDDMLADLSDEEDSELSDVEDEEQSDDVILENIIHDLKKCNKEYSQGNVSSQPKLLSWMSQKSLSMDPSTLKHKAFLQDTLVNLQKKIQQITERHDISNKAEQAHKLLSSTLSKITNENETLRSSRAYQLCEMKMEAIEAKYPHLRSIAPTKHI